MDADREAVERAALVKRIETLEKALRRLLNASVAGSEADKFEAQQRARRALDER